jgi:hypothetical protein
VRPDPADEVRVAAPGARAAGDDQQVGRVRPTCVAEVAVRHDGQAARRADLGAAEARGADPVGPLAVVVPGAGEDLKRPGDVEGLHAVEQDDQNCSHATKSSGPRSWQQ